MHFGTFPTLYAVGCAQQVHVQCWYKTEKWYDKTCGVCGLLETRVVIQTQIMLQPHLSDYG